MARKTVKKTRSGNRRQSKVKYNRRRFYKRSKRSKKSKRLMRGG
jgi:hypothetical protein